MATENLSVAAAFDLSYADLTADQQRLFRRLGLHPGTDIDAYAAAALDGTDLAAARRDLEALYDQYLLTEPARGRYRLHDLIREHARALAGRLDPDGDRDAATGPAAGLLPAHRRPRRRPPGPPGPTRPGPAAARARPRSRTWPTGAGAGLGPGRARQPARLPGPRHRHRPARPGRRPHRRPRRLCCGTTAPGPRPSPATPPRSRPHGTSVTGSARPTPSTTSGTCGG